MTKKIIIANWKINPASLKEAEKLFSEIVKNIPNQKKNEIVLCPPFVYLEKFRKVSKKISLGAQNIFTEERGAYTGEVSASMLESLGVKYIILGHSERRALGETNAEVNKKIKMALTFGLRPILCVGDTERDANHEYFNIVKNQIAECLNGIQKNLIPKILIAYEPVWAISTTPNRKDATPADSYEMSVFIRKILTDKFGVDTALPKIIYGGSVNDKDAGGFLTEGGVDGVLVGGASLNAEKFVKIIEIAEKF